jgi:hypothetical protein
MMDFQQMEQPQGGMMGGGLPALSNPMVQQVQSQGRGNDSMLVHMTPDEVNSLQGLAMAHGGSLTINPETGLPEAGILGKLLPMILGAALAATGVGAPLAAGIVGAGQFARTGSLKKGLMAGLGAFGGAGLAGAAGVGGSISNNAFGALSDKAGFFGANMGQGISQAGNIANIAKLGTAPVENAINVTGTVPGAAVPGMPVGGFTDTLIPSLPVSPVTGATIAPSGFTGQFSNAVIPGLKSGVTGALAPSGYTGAFSNAAGAGLNPVQMQALSGGSVLGTGTQAAITGVASPTATGAQFTGGLGSRFAQATRAGLPSGTPGIVSKLAPKAALIGATSGVSSALSSRPSGSMSDDGVIDNSYAGPYTAQPRSVSYRERSPIDSGDSSEQLYFSNSMPEVYNVQGQVVQPGSSTARGTPILQNVINPNAKKGQNRYNQIFTPYMVDPQQDMGYAHGGEVNMKDGSFVVDARTVSELGNGSSNAGMELLSRIGGRPLQGPGDGVSDSIRARIGGRQEARVARDEVLFPPEAVRRLGNGNPKKGTAKLYSLMNKAHKARKKADRGEDTKVRRGLA